MSNPDFRKGFNVRELDSERAEKLEYIYEGMKEATNGRKDSKVAAGKVAIDAGYEMLQMLEEQEDEERTAIRKIIDFKDRILRLEL